MLGSRSRLSVLLTLLGYGEWWRWKPATSPHCTCKVGMTCVHPFSAPETRSRSGAVGEPGSRKRRGISSVFWSFLRLADTEILRACSSVGQQAGSRGLSSGCGRMTAGSHCPLSPLACVIFQQLLCVKPFGYGSCKQLDWFKELMLTLELTTDSSVHFLILTTIYLQSQGPSQLVIKLFVP